MKIIKPILASAILLFSGLFASADEGYNAVIVNMTDGSRMGIVIESALQCCVNEDYSAIEFRYVDENELFTDAPLHFSVAHSRFKSLEMVSDYSGISAPGADCYVRPELKDGKIYLTGIKGRVNIEVYTSDGKSMAKMTADGDATIDLQRFGSGIYLVNINGITYKFPVK